MKPAAPLALLLTAAAALAQYNDNFVPDEWIIPSSGGAIYMRRFPMGESPATQMCFLIAEARPELSNAPQDVATDSECNRQLTMFSATTQWVADPGPREIVQRAAELLQYFLELQEDEQPIVVRKLHRRPEKEAKVIQARRVIAEAQTYLGGRL